MTKNEMRALAKKIISDAAAITKAGYEGCQSFPVMTAGVLLAHAVLDAFPPEDSDPVFTVDEVAALLEENADEVGCQRVAVINRQPVMALSEYVFEKRVKAALRKLKGKE